MDPAHGQPSRARVACKACRQNKIRCGMRNPPCQRCSRLNINCTVDAAYHRTSHKERVQHLEKQIQKLQAQLSQQDETASRRSRPDDPVAPSLHPRGLAEAATPTLETPGQSIGANDSKLAMGGEDSAYSVGSISLQEAQVDKLFSIFFKAYHPMLPFLDENRSPLEYYRASHLLFWSIIAVAARHFQEDSSILTKLVPVVREQLMLTVASGLASIPLVQSLLLHSCWPLPNFRFLSDPSLLNANIALTFATQLGLHVPHHEQEYTQEHTSFTKERRWELTRTWIACSVQSQSMATDMGLPPFRLLVQSAVSTSSRVASPEISLELYHNFLIQEYNQRAICTLFDGEVSPDLPSPEALFPRMEVVEKSFDSLEESVGPQLSFNNALRLSAARLYSQCLHFSVDAAQSESKRKGVLRAYSTAAALITLTISHHSAPEALAYAPAAAPRMIFTAAFVIFRVVFSSYSTALPTGLDRGTAQVLFSAASLAVHRCSVQREEKDLPARMADALKILWQGGSKDTIMQSQEPTLSVKSRFGANALFSSIGMVRNYKADHDHSHSSQSQESPAIIPPSPHENVNRPEPLQAYVASDTFNTIQTAPISDLEGTSVWNFIDDFSLDFPDDWGQYGMG